MKMFIILMVFGLSLTASAQGPSLDEATRLFAQGKYQGVIDALNKVSEKSLASEKRGFVAYWKGICYNRIQDYSKAIKEFKKSLKFGSPPKDIHYEYGQALFALDKLDQASTQFERSIEKDYKTAVSYYYVGFIAKEKGNLKQAFYEFKTIPKTGDPEAKSVVQAAEMQIADMYLSQSEKKRDPILNIRDHVIPQYQVALKADPDSPLAAKINEKIKSLQQKYDLVLLQLENGRPTQEPRHFLKLNTEVGYETNVTFSAAEAGVEKSKTTSAYGKADVLGRYTFYPTNYISVAPEFRFNQTRYFKRIPEIYRNDNYLLAPTIRTTFEHKVFDKPASVLADVGLSESQRDVNARQKLQFSSRSYTYMLGERFRLFNVGDSIFRLRYLDYTSYIDALDFHTTSLVYEQFTSLKNSTIVTVASYDLRRADTRTTNTNTLALRADWIFNRVLDLFTPSVGLGLSTIDPYNDRASRGREYLLNPNVRLSKTFLKKWRTNFKYDYNHYKSRNKTSFEYAKSLVSLDLEYLF